MALPPVPSPGSIPARLFNRFTDLHVAAFRASGGRIGGRIGRAKVLLVHHVGRKSGNHRVTPLLYAEDGKRLVIIASRGGSKAMPAWWLNLRDGPETTTVELRGGKRRVRVHEVTEDPERARLWAKAVEIWPDYAEYQQRTERRIPVIALDPA